MTRAGYGKKKALLTAYPGIEAFFAQIDAYAYREPANGELKFYPGKNPRFEISPARPGVKADEKSFYAQVYALWQNSVSAELVMPLVRIPPAVTEKDCERLTCLRGEFSTDYSRSGSGRKHNIELAMRALDGHFSASPALEKLKILPEHAPDGLCAVLRDFGLLEWS